MHGACDITGFHHTMLTKPLRPLRGKVTSPRLLLPNIATDTSKDLCMLFNHLPARALLQAQISEALAGHPPLCPRKRLAQSPVPEKHATLSLLQWN
eukprot:20897-Heterococcus_DN1.PRE.1